MKKCGQIKLLLWKNWLIIKRKWFLSMIQIILPSIFMAILMSIRTTVSADKYDEITTWPSCNISDWPFKSSKMVGYTPNDGTTKTIMQQIAQDYPINYQGKLR